MQAKRPHLLPSHKLSQPLLAEAVRQANVLSK